MSEIHVTADGKLWVTPEGKIIVGTECCCGESIGFHGSAWGVATTCFPSYSVIQNLSVDITPINQCKLLFLGQSPNACGAAPRLEPAATVLSYIQNGGRVWFQGEYGAPIGCLTNRAAVNAYLASIGSGMSINNDTDISGGSCNAATASCTAGAANIAAGSTLKIALSATITGGTSVWISNAAGVIMSVEQIGDGFLFVTGDSNIVGGCVYSPDNCEFLTRLVTYADGDII